MTSFDVVALGLNTVDVFIRIPPTVVRGTKVPARGLTIQGGGPAGTAAATTARLGFRTALACRLGRDELAQFARQQMRQDGISDALVIDDSNSRPVCAVIEIDAATAERTIFYQLEGFRPLAAMDIPSEAIRAAKVIVLDDYMPEAAVRSLLVAAESRVPSVLDLESSFEDVAGRMLELAAHAILPLAAAQRLSGLTHPLDALAELTRRTAAQVVVTDGPCGAWAGRGTNELRHQPAFAVKAVDTSGCGDAFHGAYAVGLIEGWALEERLEFAAWIAGSVAEQIGGRSGLPDRAALKRVGRGLLSPSLSRKIEALANRPE